MPKMQKPGNGMEYREPLPEAAASCRNQSWDMRHTHAEHDIP